MSAYPFMSGTVVVPEPVVTYDEDGNEVVPWGSRPAWDHGVSGGPTPWPLPDPLSSAPSADLDTPEPPRVIAAATIVPVVSDRPKAFAGLLKVALAAGWSDRQVWTIAELDQRKLVRTDEGGRYVVTRTVIVTLSLRLRHTASGRRAYATWWRPDDGSDGWSWFGGGIDGQHGHGVTAVRRAVKFEDG